MFRKIIDKFKAAAKPDPEREVVYVSGSHGELKVDLETGFVLEYYNGQGYLFDPSPEKSVPLEELEEDWAYYNISRFDLGVYPSEVKPGDHFDILELGYLYTAKSGQVKYEYPETDYGLLTLLDSVLPALGIGSKTRKNIVSHFRDRLHLCKDYIGELSPPTRTGDSEDQFGGTSLWRV